MPAPVPGSWKSPAQVRAGTGWRNGLAAAVLSVDGWAAVYGGVAQDFLHVYDFGFGALVSDTIAGVEISVTGGSSCGIVCWFTCQQITGGDGSTITIGRTQDVNLPYPTDAEVTLGGTGDNWGALLTPAIVNAAGFGFRLFKGPTTPSEVRIDRLRARIYT